MSWSVLTCHVAVICEHLAWYMDLHCCAGEVPRPPAVVQLAYRRPAPPAGEPPCTCVLLHVAATGLTPELRFLLQSAQPLKARPGDTNDA